MAVNQKEEATTNEISGLGKITFWNVNKSEPIPTGGEEHRLTVAEHALLLKAFADHIYSRKLGQIVGISPPGNGTTAGNTGTNGNNGNGTTTTTTTTPSDPKNPTDHPGCSALHHAVYVENANRRISCQLWMQVTKLKKKMINEAPRPYFWKNNIT